LNQFGEFNNYIGLQLFLTNTGLWRIEKVKNNEHSPFLYSTVKLSSQTLETWIPEINSQKLKNRIQSKILKIFLIILNKSSKV